MYLDNKDGGKDYIRVMTNIGYAIANLYGVAAGVIVGLWLHESIFSLLWVFLSILAAGAVAFIGYHVVWAITWPFRNDDKNISLVAHIIMSYLGGAFWCVLWAGHTMEYLFARCDVQKVSVVSRMFLYAFLPYYCIHWYIQQGIKCDYIAKAENPQAQSKKLMYLLLGIFVPFVASVIMQHQINNFQEA